MFEINKREPLIFERILWTLKCTVYRKEHFLFLVMIETSTDNMLSIWGPFIKRITVEPDRSLISKHEKYNYTVFPWKNALI